MTIRELFSPLDLERLGAKIDNLFGTGGIRSISLVHGGYMSRNFRVHTDGGDLFLKQYRNRISTVIHEIKHAERYFAHAGLPVIVPLEDRFSRPAFWFDENWYSVFPFVVGRNPVRDTMSEVQSISLGETLGRFHLAGERFNQRHFQQLSLWDRGRFHLEYVELREALLADPFRGERGDRILDLLERKRAFVETNEYHPGDMPLAYECLLHGDYIPSNLFVHGDLVTHVFDLEKTAIGPRAYELARSLLISCFDDGWEAENERSARAFLRGYLGVFPLFRQEFEIGMRAYAVSVMHMTWMEARLVMYGDAAFQSLYDRHARRVELLQRDIGPLCELLWLD